MRVASQYMPMPQYFLYLQTFIYLSFLLMFGDYRNYCQAFAMAFACIIPANSLL